MPIKQRDRMILALIVHFKTLTALFFPGALPKNSLFIKYTSNIQIAASASNIKASIAAEPAKPAVSVLGLLSFHIKLLGINP